MPGGAVPGDPWGWVGGSNPSLAGAASHPTPAPGAPEPGLGSLAGSVEMTFSEQPVPSSWRLSVCLLSDPC